MSLIFATELTAVATAILATFAIVTAWYARRAFLKQSQEVRAIEQQVTDAQELARQQAELLKIQSGQLELQRQQLDDQREANTRQAEVLELQASELRRSLEERTRDTAERRRAQASRVFMWTELGLDRRVTQVQRASGEAQLEAVTAHIKNSSKQPVHDIRISWRRGTAPWGEPDQIPGLLPGEQEDRTRSLDPDLPSSVNRSLFGAVAFFRDAAGVTWRTRPDGELEEISAGQEPPHTW